MTGTRAILADLLAECDAHGIRLALADAGGLTIDAPQDALTPDLLDRLKARKAQLLASIERFEERAAIMEFDAGLSRHEAERLAAPGGPARSRCDFHGDPSDWVAAPDPERPGWIRMVCRRCGTFIGYRPAYVGRRRQPRWIGTPERSP